MTTLQLDPDSHHGLAQESRHEQPRVRILILDNHGRTRTSQDPAVILEQDTRLVDSGCLSRDVPDDHGVLATCVSDIAGECVSLGETGEDVAAVLAVFGFKVGRVVDRAFESDRGLQSEFRRGGGFERAEVKDTAGSVAEQDLAVGTVA